MDWFKELWFIITLIFKSKPSDISELVYTKMKYFPWSGYSAMCWCGHILYKSETAHSTETDIHETGHLYQAKAKGSWFKYYTSYLWWWLRSGFNYYLIPYEIEAYANEEKPEYWKNYDSNTIWTKYRLTRKDWEEHGGKTYSGRRKWKEWIKTL